jgi:methylated-DNA-[protein]-cysteine S-methyltransferase
MSTLEIGEVATPIGTVCCAVSNGRLCALEFVERWPRRVEWLRRQLGPRVVRSAADPAGVVGRLADYFHGRLDALGDVPVEMIGTDFQRRVWSALRDLPAGRTTSYGALAQALRRPDASRAVGAANGANPIALVVPCHRVVGADGALTGYAGGLERKRWLLAHEQRHAVSASAARAAASAPPRRSAAAAS